MPKTGNFVFGILFYNLHGTTAWFACVVVYVDRTEGFSLSNLIQMWRQTLNQGAFRRKLKFHLPFMVLPIHSVDQEQLLTLFIKSRYKMFQECLEGEAGGTKSDRKLHAALL
ncbi:hypothetical protein T09_11757 [Trichinella sp. T9]|nr:hypothetical protein T09_11757 [Trichinella sp. T9]